MSTRTAHSLKRRTQFVTSFELPSFGRTLEIRKLKVRVNRPHFLVIFADSMFSEDYEDVFVITEVSFERNCPRYSEWCFADLPELDSFKDLIKLNIDSIINNNAYDIENINCIELASH